MKNNQDFPHPKWYGGFRLLKLTCFILLPLYLTLSQLLIARHSGEVDRFVERIVHFFIPTDKETDMLAFACEHPWGNSNLYTIYPDGSHLRLIKKSNFEHYRSLIWSPDGIWIALEIKNAGYRSVEGLWNSGVYSTINRIRFDGAVSRRFTPIKQSDRNPQWSHDGASIFFHASYIHLERQRGIYRIAVDSGKSELIKQLDNDLYVVSPNGVLLSIVPNPTENPSLNYSLHRDHAGLALWVSSMSISRVTGSRHQHWATNDEGFLYYEHAGRLHVFNVATLVREFALTMRVLSAKWSPNGKWIAIIGGKDEFQENGEWVQISDDKSFRRYFWQNNLYLVNATTGRVVEISKDVNSAGVAWSPDSEWIAFSSRAHNGQLVKIKRGGTTIQQLTNLDCVTTALDWSPK